MKTQAYTAKCLVYGHASHVSSVLALLVFAQISFAQTNLVSRPVGIVRVQILSGSSTLVSIPFRPFDPSVNAVLQGQLTGARTEDASDAVLKWDPSKPGYVKAVKADGTGDSSIDDKWFKDFTDLEASDMTLEPGEGFFICNKQSTTQSVVLAGEVVLDDENAMLLYPALNLVGYPYSSAAEGMKMGSGYWLNNTGAESSVWIELRPYENGIFPTNNMPPAVTGITVGEDGKVTLEIVGTGVEGELLEVYSKDMSVTGRLELSTGWVLVAEGLSAGSDGHMQWTDETEIKDEAPIRYYVIALSGRGVSAILAGEGGEPLVCSQTANTRGAGSSDDFSVVNKSGLKIKQGMPGLLMGRIIYVDKLGSDRRSGRSRVVVGEDGPVRTIRRGLDMARGGETICISSGVYNEAVNFCEKDVNVIIEGQVTIP